MCGDIISSACRQDLHRFNIKSNNCMYLDKIDILISVGFQLYVAFFKWKIKETQIIYNSLS